MAQFASGTFTGTDGTELSAHDANWTKQSGTPNLILANNRVRATATGSVYYYHAGTPASADYSVSADIVQMGSSGTANIGPTGRGSISGTTFYHARFSHGVGFMLMKATGGGPSQLGSTAGPTTLTADTTYRLKLDMVGSTIRLLVDDVELVSVTDTSITDAGKAGIRAAATPTTPNDTNGQQLDNFSADDAGGAPTDATGTIAVTLADVVLAASGTVATNATGTIAATLADVTMSASGVVASADGSLTFEAVLNNDTSLDGVEVDVLVTHETDLDDVIALKTGVTVGADGVTTITDALFIEGTTYNLVIRRTDTGKLGAIAVEAA